MTIKLLLLKSGEDLIANVSEMAVGEGENQKIVGYILNRPCIVKMRNPSVVSEQDRNVKSGYEVSLFPWLPLSADENIPTPADWVITIVEPVVKLKEMYIEDVIENGKANNQSNSADEQSNSSESD
jgi:hypothetical protein